MKGTVLTVDSKAGDALVTGDDGIRYRFAVADWREQRPPVKGQRVDLVIAVASVRPTSTLTPMRSHLHTRPRVVVTGLRADPPVWTPDIAVSTARPMTRS
jgi:hypothetical protein